MGSRSEDLLARQQVIFPRFASLITRSSHEILERRVQGHRSRADTFKPERDRVGPDRSRNRGSFKKKSQCVLKGNLSPCNASATV
jgi:hypothetical protein